MKKKICAILSGLILVGLTDLSYGETCNERVQQAENLINQYYTVAESTYKVGEQFSSPEKTVVGKISKIRTIKKSMNLNCKNNGYTLSTFPCEFVSGKRLQLFFNDMFIDVNQRMCMQKLENYKY